jgi:formylglycine-generating enzyme required for sulfatase activity
MTVNELTAPHTTEHHTPAPDAPDRLSHGDARTLAGALAEARRHTLGLAHGLAKGLPPSLEVRYLPELSPPLWLLAELAWREDGWIARNPLRRMGAVSADGFARGPAAWPQYERSFAPKLSHADRWHQPLPSLQATLAWLQASRERTLTLLRSTTEQDQTLHVYRDALWREDALREVLLGIAQTLGILPGPLAAAPLPCPATHTAAETELELPVDTHRLGTPATGYAPEGDQPEREMALRAFSIARSPVTWGRYLPFIEAGGYDEPRWWTPEGWAWRRRQNLGRPRHLSRTDEGHWQLAQFGQWVPLNPSWPAVHISRHEALAWCRWAGRRLPSEHEWEAAARAALASGEVFAWGQVREWTASAHSPVPAPAQDAQAAPAATTPRPSCVRGASHLGAPRLATLWRRWAALDESNDGFVGFRSCAARDPGTPGDETEDMALSAVAQPEEHAPQPARRRASRT